MPDDDALPLEKVPVWAVESPIGLDVFDDRHEARRWARSLKDEGVRPVRIWEMTDGQ